MFDFQTPTGEIGDVFAPPEATSAPKVGVPRDIKSGGGADVAPRDPGEASAALGFWADDAGARPADSGPAPLGGAGAQAPDGVVATMAARLGIEPGTVRLHTDGNAAAHAGAMGARAFTQGRDIGFGRGMYDPGSEQGNRLIGHELAHVAQQAHGGPATQMKAEAPGATEPAEAEADRAADQLAGGGGPVSVTQRVGGARIHRKPEDGAPQPGAAELDKGQHLLAEARAIDLFKLQQLPDRELGDPGMGTADELAARARKLESEAGTVYGKLILANQQIILQFTLGAVAAARVGAPAIPELSRLPSAASELMGAAAAANAKVQARLSSARQWEADLRRKEVAKGEKAKAGGDVSGKAKKGFEGTEHEGDRPMKHEVEGSASVKDGTATLEGKASGEKHDAEAHEKDKQQAGAKGWASASGAGGEASYERTKTHGVDADDERIREKAREQERLDYEMKKARGEIPADQKFESAIPDAKHSSDSHKTTGGVEMKDGVLTGTAGHTQTHTNQDGTGTSRTGTLKGGVDKDGNFSAEAGGELAATDAKGEKTAQAGGSVQVDKNGVDVKAHGGTGNVDVGGELIYKQGQKGFKGNVKIGGETKSFTVGGGHVVTFSPVQELAGGKFAVTCTVTDDVSVGGSGGAQNEAKTSGVNAGASVSSAHAKSMTKVFESAEAADAFRTAENVPGDLALPRNPAAARSLKPGESIEEGSSGGVSANVGASTTGASASVGGGVESSNSTRVERKPGNVVQVSQTVRHGVNGSISVGNLVTVGGSADAYTLHRITMEVDLGPAELPNPGADVAYGFFMSQGQVLWPAKEVSHRVEHGKGTASSAGAGAGGLGVKYGDRSETVEGETVEANGDVTRDTTGKHTASASYNLFLLSGSMEESTALRAIDVNHEKRGYSVEVNVNDSAAGDTQRALAEATGTKQDNVGVEQNDKAKSSGTWTVQSQMSVKSVDHVFDSIKSGKFDPRFATMGEHGKKDYAGNDFTAGAEFAKAVKAAGDDPDKLRRALAQFVADGGEMAVKMLRGWGGGDSEYHLQLTDKDGKPDPNFRGIEGRLEAEEKIGDFERRAGDGEGDKQGLAMEIKGFMSRVRARIMSITPERYSDVPPQLLSTELAHSQGDLGKLEAILAKVKGAIDEEKGHGDAKPKRHGRHKSVEEMEDEGTLHDPLHDPKLSGGPVASAAARQQQLLSRMRESKAQAQGNQAKARGKQHAHLVGFEGGKATPRKYMTSDGDAEYAVSDKEFARALSLWLAGQIQENMALVAPDFDDNQIEGMLGFIQSAADIFANAASGFSYAGSILDNIQKTHADRF